VETLVLLRVVADQEQALMEMESKVFTVVLVEAALAMGAQEGSILQAQLRPQMWKVVLAEALVVEFYLRMKLFLVVAVDIPAAVAVARELVRAVVAEISIQVHLLARAPTRDMALCELNP
jgi:hypothetical protein